MAETGTLLYNQEQKPIYPISYATAIKTSGDISVNNKEYVEDCLVDLYSAIASLKGDEDTVSSILVDVLYCITTSNREDEARENTNWQRAFISPTSNFPYTWKKTTFTYAGDTTGGKTIYEIVATSVLEKTETIYTAMATTAQPVIEYPTLRDENGDPILDEDGNELKDLTAYDENLPKDWSDIPVPISASTPFVYISTRKMVNGKWLKFSNPALFGRWAFDSQLELRYLVTTDGSTPSVNYKSDNPGEDWKLSAPTEFSGKLWMITATSVNGVINTDSEDIRWKGPNLMAIV